MKRRPWARATIAPAALLGAVLGVLVMHPAASAFSWFDLPGGDPARLAGPWRFMARRFVVAFTPSMAPMTALFGLVGAGVGVVLGLYARRRGAGPGLDDTAWDLDSLIMGGESERLEFKASARWDHRLGRPNRALEDAVARSIAGFLNHRGGCLLIGVTDGGGVVGLSQDYDTLRRPDRDGFEQFIMSLVRTRLGGDVCSLVHIGFAYLVGREVCRILVERAERPVYCVVESIPRYFLRVGNSTRELNVQEAVEHVARRAREER